MVRAYPRQNDVFHTNVDLPVHVDITKEDFEAYVDVQMSGRTNMFDVERVSNLSGLGRAKIMAIMESYGELSQKWPDVTHRGRM